MKVRRIRVSTGKFLNKDKTLEVLRCLVNVYKKLTTLSIWKKVDLTPSITYSYIDSELISYHINCVVL